MIAEIPGLFFYTPRCEHIGIRYLIPGTLKAIDFYDTPFSQFGKTEVYLTQADSHSFCHITLGYVGFPAQNLEEAIFYLLFISVVHEVNFKDIYENNGGHIGLKIDY